MIELISEILNRMSFVALTALLQSVLILGLACLAEKLMCRRHAVCHAICFGAILSCLICAVLAYGVISVGFSSPWSYRISDGIAVDNDSAPQPTINAEESFDDIGPGSISEPRLSKTVPSSTPGALMSESQEETSSAAVQLAESKHIRDAEVSHRASELSHPAHQSAGAASEMMTSASVASSTPDRVVQLEPASPQTAIRFAAVRWFVVGWCLLVVMFASRMVFRSLRLTRLLADARVVNNPEVQRLAKDISERTGLRQVPSVVVGSKLFVPFICGMSSSTIAIPEFLLHPSCVEQLRDVLAHEMCHLRRGDLWTSFLQRTVQMVYCINPFVHVIAARMTRVREEICDNQVLQFTLQLDIAEPCCPWRNVFRRETLAVVRCTCCR